MKTIRENIAASKESFEKSFQDGTFYQRQTADEKHLQLLLSLLAPIEQQHILDLGTGNGYVAFALASQYSACIIKGLDIVTATLQRNQEKARQQNLNNLQFIAYDGLHYPFADESIDSIITRYALHHFPDLSHSIGEMHRILRKHGRLVIADPTPNCNDTVGFVDAFMQKKTDGHIQFYSFAQLNALLQQFGFVLQQRVTTTIRFPRKNPQAYFDLLHRFDREIWEGYAIIWQDDEIWITEQVNNLVYEKQ